MSKILEKTWFWLFSNYMWLYIISGIGATILGVYIMTYQFLMCISFIFFFCILVRYRISNFLDIFVLLFCTWILLNSLAIDFNNHWKLWYEAVIGTLIPILFYFIGKTVKYDTDLLLQKATLPMMVAIIFGLFFYFLEPEWYIAQKMNKVYDLVGNTSEISQEIMVEFTRLSSFWGTPYVIGYSSMYFACYNLCRVFDKTKSKIQSLLHLLLLLLCMVTIVLTQFRAVLVSLVLCIVYMLFFTKYKITKSYLLVFIGVGLVFLSLSQVIEFDRISFFIEKLKQTLTQEHIIERLNYTGGGIDYDLIFGNGFGRYGMFARSLNNEWVLIDSQYQKILIELGLLGFVPFLGLIFVGLVMSFRHVKLHLEFIILLFFIIAFIGSSCISAATTSPFIFWYVLGRISKMGYYKSIIT